MSRRFPGTAALLPGVALMLCQIPLHADPIFNVGPVSGTILTATFSADFAELSADETVFGTQVNHVQLIAQGFPLLDLSDAFFGASAYPATPAINQGPTQTGVVSTPIPSSFFPALTSGLLGYDLLFTDTSDGMFALGFIELQVTSTTGTFTSIVGPNDGFGLGVPLGGNLPQPLPISLPFGATGTGFDETISSKNLQATVPEPRMEGLLMLALGAGILLRRRWKAGVILCTLFIALSVAARAATCPPVPQPAAVPVPGKPGESGWLIEDVEADANGNKIQLWCLKSVPGPNPPAHGGPDFALLYKPKGAKDADAVWVGACTFVGGQNQPNKDFTKLPNGQPKQFTKVTWFNFEPPPNGANDWHYSYDTASGNLTVSKTQGAYAAVVDKITGAIKAIVYITTKVVGMDTYAAPKNFGDLKFMATQVTQLFPGPNGISAEAFTTLASAAGTNWSYSLNTTSQGGTGTDADPFVGSLSDLKTGDTFSIAAAGIQDPFVSSPASLPAYGGWVVDSFGANFVTFRATADAEFVPGFQIPGFGFTSSAPPGQVPWGLESSNETIGSSGIVSGPMYPADQLHLAGPMPNQVGVGQDGSITAMVEGMSVPIPGASVTFTKLAGAFTLNQGNVAPDGSSSTMNTGTNGAAVMTVTAGAPGVGLVKVTVAGSTLAAYSLFFMQ